MHLQILVHCLITDASYAHLFVFSGLLCLLVEVSLQPICLLLDLRTVTWLEGDQVQLILLLQGLPLDLHIARRGRLRIEFHLMQPTDAHTVMH